ncbi:hypothetical protein BaRGS_00039559 [Batillaria attramentaria]|uniref:Uncharacterized protein n=1 Tax=Batillaria attramentaria TaxID=370345 RepID=A0ABD0J343_9CAEN
MHQGKPPWTGDNDGKNEVQFNTRGEPKPRRNSESKKPIATIQPNSHQNITIQPKSRQNNNPTKTPSQQSSQTSIATIQPNTLKRPKTHRVPAEAKEPNRILIALILQAWSD